MTSSSLKLIALGLVFLISTLVETSPLAALIGTLGLLGVFIVMLNKYEFKE